MRPASRRAAYTVHYDICSKHCPSQIMNNGDWERFKKLISSSSSDTPKQPEKKTYDPGVYKVNTDLNIREKPDADSRCVGTIKDRGSYTVTEIQNTSWGRLLSGAGWINCHTKYCTYGGAAPKEEQKPTAKAISIDGVWGSGALPGRLQEIFGDRVDGKSVTNPRQTRNTASYHSGRVEQSSVRRISSDQGHPEMSGVTADGYIGPQTIRAMQRKLGTQVDGVISNPSAMVRALQEWCNRQ